MNIKMNSITSYTNFKNNNKNSAGIFKNNALNNSNSSMTAAIQSRYAEDQRSEKAIKNDKLRDLIRGLTTPKNANNNNPHSATLSNKTNGYLDLNSAYEKKAKSALAKYKYNSKEVSSRIQSAKTSVSAGQAVIAAKRKVLEIKRKLSVKTDDNAELQAALIHAERMEMAARKKMHNLEQEELISNTMKRDEANEKSEKINDLASYTQEMISEKEDAIFEERYEMLEDVVKEVQDQETDNLSDEMIENINQLIESFGEDVIQELEEAMEIAETMEVIDPHMNEEGFNKLKAKHRASEQKAIMKADLDYLKAIIKISVETQMKSSDISPVSMAGPNIGAISNAPAPISSPEATGTEGASFDLSL